MEAHGLAPCKKTAARLVAHLVFVDESGFLLIPSVRNTWYPVGQTPLLRYRYRHDRIAAIAGSPKRVQCTLYGHLYEDNMQGEDVLTFLRHLLRQVRGQLIVLLDNGTIHRGEPVQELLTRTSRLHVVSFPAYAPELNPDEGVWKHLKRALANGRPDTQAELRDVLATEIGHLGASPHLLRRCIQHAGMSLLWP